MAANLAGLARSYRALARVPSQVAKDIAERYNERLQDGFDAGTDPYGVEWEALAPFTIAKGRFPPPLTDKGDLRAQARLVPMQGTGLQFVQQVPYGFVHMSGRADMPKRRYLPDAGLPAAWRADLRAALAARVAEKF